MKTQKLIIISFLVLNCVACAACATTQPTISNGTTADIPTTTTVLVCTANCTPSLGDRLLGAFAEGFGAGLGWGMGSAITRNW